jgi:hypothetical protein
MATMIQISVKVPDHETLQMMVAPSDSSKAVSMRVSELGGLGGVKNFRLRKGSVNLKADMTMAEAGVVNGDTLTTVKRSLPTPELRAQRRRLAAPTTTPASSSSEPTTTAAAAEPTTPAEDPTQTPTTTTPAEDPTQTPTTPAAEEPTTTTTTTAEPAASSSTAAPTTTAAEPAAAVEPTLPQLINVGACKFTYYIREGVSGDRATMLAEGLEKMAFAAGIDVRHGGTTSMLHRPRMHRPLLSVQRQLTWDIVRQFPDPKVAAEKLRGSGWTRILGDMVILQDQPRQQSPVKDKVEVIGYNYDEDEPLLKFKCSADSELWPFWPIKFCIFAEP